MNGVAEGIARSALAALSNKEEILAAFRQWWRETHIERNESLVAVTARPATQHFAAQLTEAGRQDLAAFALACGMSPAQSLDSITWQFAILSGESAVGPFLDLLRNGRCEAPNFFGMHDCGAWEAFECGLREALRTDPTATEAGFVCLRASIETAVLDVTDRLRLHARHSAHLQDRIRKFQDSPDFNEVWRQSSDIPLWPAHLFLWKLLLELRAEETLPMLASLPHPLLMRPCLEDERVISRPEEIARLIVRAPSAVSPTGILEPGRDRHVGASG